MRLATHTALTALTALAVATMAAAPAHRALGALGAQGTTATTDARWEAFVGCWAPEAGIPGPTAVCVLPVGGARVELVTIADGKVATRESIDASGVRLASVREKCEGGDVARWSADGRRLFLVSDHICDGATRVRATGIMAMPNGNEWLDVRGVSVAGGPADVRVRRYQAIAATAAAIPEALALEVQAATAERPTIRAAARANAASEIGIDETIEASRTIDAAVLEAWLVENGDGFEVDRAKLVRLADAKVPARVIDVMVALSYPNKFAIGRRWRRGEVPQPKVDTTVTGATDVATTPIYGGMYGTYGSLDSRNRFCDDGLITAVSRCYGYGDAYGYGYSPYGWGNSGWGYGYGQAPGRPPVIVVNPGREQQRGRVANGKGYTRGETPEDGSGRTAQPRSNGGSNGSGGSSGDRATTRSRGGSTRSNDAGTKSSGGERSSTGRTAKPKNP